MTPVVWVALEVWRKKTDGLELEPIWLFGNFLL